MDVQEIEVFVDVNGEVQIHVRGATGMECLSLTAPLEVALGPVTSRELTPEAYEDPQHESIEQSHGF